MKSHPCTNQILICLTKLQSKNIFINYKRNWTDTYANPDKVNNNKVKDLMDMGFSEDDAKLGLAKNNFDLEAACNYLLNR